MLTCLGEALFARRGRVPAAEAQGRVAALRVGDLVGSQEDHGEKQQHRDHKGRLCQNTRQGHGDCLAVSIRCCLCLPVTQPTLARHKSGWGICEAPWRRTGVAGSRRGNDSTAGD